MGQGRREAQSISGHSWRVSSQHKQVGKGELISFTSIQSITVFSVYLTSAVTVPGYRALLLDDISLIALTTFTQPLQSL